jgi:Fur family transcriptional regulator, ferric uptake regulator
MDDLWTKLRAKGGRLTLPRKMVLEALRESGAHLTVEGVRRQLEAQGHDLDSPTIYRVLQWLKEMGVVSQTDLGGEAIMYQFLAGKPHHHLVCLSCGEVSDLDDCALENLRRRLRNDNGFEPRIDHLAIFGLCKRCRR